MWGRRHNAVRSPTPPQLLRWRLRNATNRSVDAVISRRCLYVDPRSHLWCHCVSTALLLRVHSVRTSCFSLRYVHSATPKSCCLIHRALLTFHLRLYRTCNCASAMSTRRQKFKMLYNSKRCSILKLDIDEYVKRSIYEYYRTYLRTKIEIMPFCSDVFTCSLTTYNDFFVGLSNRIIICRKLLRS